MNDFHDGQQQLPSKLVPAPEVNQLEKSMYNACEAGDVQSLQQLLKVFALQEAEQSARPPRTLARLLVYTAVKHKRSSVLVFILEECPDLGIGDELILQAAFDNPDLEVFKLLHEHSPLIVHCDQFFNHGNALSEACRGGNPLIPDYLLDHGADPNQSALGPWRALHCAITGDQPLELITKMVKVGACVTSSEVLYAVRRGDPDILAFVLPKYSEKIQGTVGDYVAEDLKVIKDPELRIIVEKRLQRNNTTTAENHSKGGKDDQKKATKDTDAVEKERYEKRSNPNRSWWQVWR